MPFFTIEDCKPLHRCLARMQKIDNQRTKRKYSNDRVRSDFEKFFNLGYSVKDSLHIVKFIIRGLITSYDIWMLSENRHDAQSIAIVIEDLEIYNQYTPIKEVPYYRDFEFKHKRRYK